MSDILVMKKNLFLIFISDEDERNDPHDNGSTTISTSKVTCLFLVLITYIEIKTYD